MLTFFRNYFARKYPAIPDTAVPEFGDDQRTEMEVRMDEYDRGRAPIKIQAGGLVKVDGKAGIVLYVSLYQFPNGTKDWAAMVEFDGDRPFVSKLKRYPASSRYWDAGRGGVPTLRKNAI